MINNNYKRGLKKFHKKWMADLTSHVNPIESIAKAFYVVLFCSVVVILFPLLFTWIIIADRNWNAGVCRKCGIGKHILYDYNSDRIRQDIYECNNCHIRFRSMIEYDEISDKELKIKIRENKLKRIGV